MRAAAVLALSILLGIGAQPLAQDAAATPRAQLVKMDVAREPMPCEEAQSRQDRAGDPAWWWPFSHLVPAPAVPAPKGWPDAYLPSIEDAGDGFAPRGTLPGAGGSDGVEHRSTAMHLADNPSDAIYAKATLHRSAEHAQAWIDVELSCEDHMAWDCSYYPTVMVHSGRVVTLLTGAYEPHDGREGTDRMYAGILAGARAVAERVDGEVIVCEDWTPQKEQLLTPSPTPNPTPP